MVIGIDFGITTIDVALLKEGKIKKVFSIEKPVSSLKGELASNGISLGEDKVAVTGSRVSKFAGNCVQVEEVDAIGAGGCFLSDSKNALVVSMGTGTCIVSFKNGKAEHVAGTGVGGGTILGLSKRLLGTSNIKALQDLASKGCVENVDLSVKEAIGHALPSIPAEATASNLIKDGNAAEDVALGVQNMVGETNASLAALAAKAFNQKKIVFTGKAAAFPAVKLAIEKVLKYYGLAAEFPPNFQYATAVGAAAVTMNFK